MASLGDYSKMDTCNIGIFEFMNITCKNYTEGISWYSDNMRSRDYISANNV